MQGHHIGYCSCNLQRVRHVNHMHRRSPGESCYRFAQRFFAPSEGGHLGTSLEQKRGCCGTNAGTCAGDNGDVTGEIHEHPFREIVIRESQGDNQYYW